MADDRAPTLVGPAEMGNTQVGKTGMAEAQAADAARWARLNNEAIEQAAKARQALTDGTSSTAEEVAIPKPGQPGNKDRQPITTMEITDRLIAEQLVNLKRSATDWVVNTVTFESSTVAQQLAGRRPLRDTVLIFNASATTTIGNARNSLVNTTNLGLASGASLAIETEGPVWATATQGTTVVVLESFWDIRKIADVVEEIRARLSTTVQQQVS